MADNLTDLAVMVRPPADLDTVSEPFAPHPYVIIAAPDHPLAGKKRIPVARLSREPFVVRERGSDTRQSMEEGFGRAMDSLQIAMEIKSTETHQAGGRCGHGHQLHFCPHHQSRATGWKPGRAGCSGFPADAQLVRCPPHKQASAGQAWPKAFKAFLQKEGAALITQITGVAARPPHRKPR